MKEIVALDLDDLVFPFMETYVPYINAHKGTSFVVEDFFSFNFEEVVGGTRVESVAFVERFFDQMDRPPAPVKGSREAVSKLSDEYDLAIVTSRTDAMRERTLDWLEEHFPATFIEVHITNGYVADNRPTKRRKSDVCRELGAVALVDDGFHNVVDVLEVGIKGLLFGDFPWNRNVELPEGVVRVSNWNEVVDELLAEPRR